MATTPEVHCPRCKGSGSGGPAFVRAIQQDGSIRCRFEEQMKCSLCGGSGMVDARYPARKALGDRLREARTARDLSLREFAKLVGYHPSEVSAWEWGRDEVPAKVLAWIDGGRVDG